MGFLNGVGRWIQRMTGGGVTATGEEQSRFERLAALAAQYEGEQYEESGLAPPWTKQRTGAPRVPIRFQQPSVQYDLAKVIVDRPSALLFGEGRFPHIAFENAPGESDKEVDAWLAAIAEEGGLQAACLLWAQLAGVRGSGVITWCVADNGDGEGEFCFEAHKSEYCKPTFHQYNRRRLILLEKRYKFIKEIEEPVDGKLVLKHVEYWHREEWTETEHCVYDEVPVGEGREPRWTVSPENRVIHNYGRVPARWVKTLDNGEPGDCDGYALIAGLTDVFEDIDRTLSHSGRALHYNLEPDKVYTGLPLDQTTKKPMVVGGGGSTSLPEGADAKILEMTGSALERAEERIDAQRGRALETSRVVVPDADTIARAATSGAAQRMLLAPTLELVGQLRTTFGRALRDMLVDILAVARAGKLTALGVLATPPPGAISRGRVKLTWGQLVDPTPQDLQLMSAAAASLKVSRVFDHETILRILAPYYGIQDIQQVLANVELEEAEAAANAPDVDEPDVDEPPVKEKPE